MRLKRRCRSGCRMRNRSFMHSIQSKFSKARFPRLHTSSLKLERTESWSLKRSRSTSRLPVSPVYSLPYTFVACRHDRRWHNPVHARVHYHLPVVVETVVCHPRSRFRPRPPAKNGRYRIQRILNGQGSHGPACLRQRPFEKRDDLILGSNVVRTVVVSAGAVG